YKYLPNRFNDWFDPFSFNWTIIKPILKEFSLEKYNVYYYLHRISSDERDIFIKEHLENIGG
ncbi:MAG: hypothetical protein QW478_11535, partial [Candidatus Micrarchaeaceae archaeon]